MKRPIVDLMRPTVYGKGYLGEGEFRRSLNGVNTFIYGRWVNILTRCYSAAYHRKQPTYIGCIVSEEWLNYQNFAKWFEENYIEGFDIDKDLLIQGNRVYSKQTCRFIPRQINSLLISNSKSRGLYPIGVSKYKNLENRYKAHICIDNVVKNLGYFDTPQEAFLCYKTAKEENIKRVASKWKEQIDPQIYQKLIEWKIESGQ